MSRDDAPPGAAEILRSEEELVVEPREVTRTLGVRKDVELYDVEQDIPRNVEHAVIDRIDAADEDTGMVETLADGSVSIPVFEERLEVRKKLVVRERLIVRKQTTVETATVRGTVRREVVAIDADASADVSVASEAADRPQ